MKLSLKQLFRTPGKALLLVLLTAAGTVLVTVSTALYLGARQRLEVMEREFTTIGMVEQVPVSTSWDIVENSCLGRHTNVYAVFDEMLSPDDLLFEGAGYLRQPENRNYYLTYLPELKLLRDGDSRFRNAVVLSFTALEDSDGTEPAQAQVRSVFLHELDFSQKVNILRNSPGAERQVSEGELITVCQHFAGVKTDLRQGDTYIMGAVKRYCAEHGRQEFIACVSPYTSQCGSDGTPLAGSVPGFPAMRKTGDRFFLRTDVVGGVPDYLNPVPPVEALDTSRQLPEKWSAFLLAQREQAAYFPILGTDSTQLLPTFHSGNAFISQGRNITEEEFSSGARVCLIPQEWIALDEYWDSPFQGFLGRKLNLSPLCTLSGFSPERQKYGSDAIQQRYSLLDADGKRYSSFFSGGYEVVGVYALTNSTLRAAGKTELSPDTIIIPQRSLPEHVENYAYVAPMNAFTASFQIENGTAEAFDRKLRGAVPGADQLRITYDDNGYEEMKSSFSELKRSAMLLFLGGIFAAFGTTALLVYFFVVRRKRQAAIARSLGATKKQCRMFFLSGLFLLVAMSCALGSAAGRVLLEKVAPFSSGQETEVVEEGVTHRYFGYDIAFSAWAEKLKNPDLLEQRTQESNLPYLLAPLCQFLLTAVPALLLLEKAMRSDPLLLLSQKQE